MDRRRFLAGVAVAVGAAGCGEPGGGDDGGDSGDGAGGGEGVGEGDSDTGGGEGEGDTGGGEGETPVEEPPEDEESGNETADALRDGRG